MGCARTRSATSTPSLSTSTRRLLTCNCSRTCGNLARKSGKYRGERRLRQCHRAAIFRLPARLRARELDRLKSCIGLGQHRGGVTVDLLPDRRHHEAPRGAVHQAHVQLRLERCDVTRQPRAGNRQGAGGRRKSAVLHRPGEVVEPLKRLHKALLAPNTGQYVPVPLDTQSLS